MHILQNHLTHKHHVIWDWNGTLLEDIDHAVRAVNQLLREENLAAVTVEEYRQLFGFPVIDYYKRLGFDTSPDSFRSLCERFNHIFHEGLVHCRLWPGALETLEHVKKSGKIQSVLSASEQTMLDNSMETFNLRHLFDHVFGIHDKLASSKVERGRQLIDRAAVPLEQTILIGDTDHDLEVGQALGIDVILVEHGHQCPTRLRPMHPRVVKVF